MVFNYASIDDHNKVIFEEWTSSSEKNQLFFKENNWLISEGPWDTGNLKIKSTDCPMKGIEFVNPTNVFQQQTFDWQSCSTKCSDKG